MASYLPDPDELSADQRAVYDLLPSNLTRGLLLTGCSAEPYLSLGRSFRHGYLSAAVRELVILRVGSLTASRYELHHHLPEARRAGLSDEHIDAVIDGSRSLGRPDFDALLAFVDRLVDAVRGATPPPDALDEYFSRNEIAEVVLLVGHYVMTSLFLRTLGIEPEDGPGEHRR